jgi:hypothetical protein
MAKVEDVEELPSGELFAFVTSDEFLRDFKCSAVSGKASLEWHLRVYGNELLKADAILPRGGRAKTLIHPQRFSDTLLALLRKQARQRAGLLRGERKRAVA